MVGEDLLAELWPTHVAVAGRVDTFEAFIQTHFVERPVGSRSEGFDEMQLVMPSGVPVDLLGIDVGVDSQTGAAKQEFRPSGVDGIFVDDEGEELQVLTSPTDSVRVRWSSNVNILPSSEAKRTFNSVTASGDQVPVDHEGLPLSGNSLWSARRGGAGENPVLSPGHSCRRQDSVDEDRLGRR